MKAKMLDAKTLEVRPEDVSELESLRRFAGGVVKLDVPLPFEDNIPVLKITTNDVPTK